jgi:hypothetical protein
MSHSLGMCVDLQWARLSSDRKHCLDHSATNVAHHPTDFIGWSSAVWVRLGHCMMSGHHRRPQKCQKRQQRDLDFKKISALTSPS